MDVQLEAARLEGKSVPEELLRMTGMIQRVFQEAGGKLPIFLEFLTKAEQSPVVWQATVVPFRKYHEFFSHMVQAGVAEGSLRPANPAIAANVLLSFAVGLLALGLFDPLGADWGQVAQEGMTMLLEGLEKRDEE